LSGDGGMHCTGAALEFSFISFVLLAIFLPFRPRFCSGAVASRPPFYHLAVWPVPAGSTLVFLTSPLTEFGLRATYTTASPARPCQAAFAAMSFCCNSWAPGRASTRIRRRALLIR
jgi:hypothetical protein